MGRFCCLHFFSSLCPADEFVRFVACLCQLAIEPLSPGSNNANVTSRHLLQLLVLKVFCSTSCAPRYEYLLELIVGPRTVCGNTEMAGKTKDGRKRKRQA